MRSVSAIIFINLACVYGWNTFIPPMHFDRFTDLSNNVNIRPSDSSNVTAHHIQLPLDHFNSSEKRTIRIWYEQNLDFWQPNGPIYIWPLTGWFTDVPLIARNDTFIFALARETKGAIFQLQERYYAPSIPKIPKSEEKTYWNYLSTKQQLTDIAEFIKNIKSKPEFQSSKVVLMGTDYAGNHATWMRAVYPNLVDAAVAVSAPLLAKKDVKEILEFTAEIYDKYGHKGCINEMDGKFQEFTDALKNETALDIFRKKHHICNDGSLSAVGDQELYMSFRYSLCRDTLNMGDLKTLKDCICLQEDLFSTKSKPVQGCNTWIYSERVSIMKRMKLAEDYQSCTEYGQNPTTSAKKRPFERYGSLNFSLQFCNDVFGIDEKRMDEGIAQTNLMYGGLTPNVTNVVFTQGELCPIKFLGVQQNLSDSAPAFVVKEDGWYNIMLYEENEPTDRIEVRNRLRTLIKKWIGL